MLLRVNCMMRNAFKPAAQFLLLFGQMVLWLLGGTVLQVATLEPWQPPCTTFAPFNPIVALLLLWWA